MGKENLFVRSRLRDPFPAVGVHKKTFTNGVCSGFQQLQEDRTKKSGRAASRWDLLPIFRNDTLNGENDPCNPQ